jgi:hypothetical protein
MEDIHKGDMTPKGVEGVGEGGLKATSVWAVCFPFYASSLHTAEIKVTQLISYKLFKLHKIE